MYPLRTSSPRPSASILLVDDIEIELTRKDIKTLRLSIQPPEGRVRLSAPRSLSDSAIRRLLVGKLDWIRKHRARLAQTAAPPRHGFEPGEAHFFLGRPRRLVVLDGHRRPRIELEGEDALLVRLRPGSQPSEIGPMLERWYRSALADLIPPLLSTWEGRLGVKAAAWGIRRMTSRWGSCNISARRIWLNLELARRPLDCLEYVLVHELAHLLERGHGPRFKTIMSEQLPRWRELKALLAAPPEAWAAWVERSEAQAPDTRSALER